MFPDGVTGADTPLDGIKRLLRGNLQRRLQDRELPAPSEEAVQWGVSTGQFLPAIARNG